MREIGVGFSSEEGTMVISLATNESSCEWGQRRTRLAKNGSESHFSNLSLSCREKGFRVLGTRVQRFWTHRGFLTFSLFFSLVRGYFFFFFFWPFKFQIFLFFILTLPIWIFFIFDLHVLNILFWSFLFDSVFYLVIKLKILKPKGQ